MAVDAARLGSLPLFARLSRRERGKVAKHCHAVLVEQGQHLLDEGFGAYEFYVIEDGKAAVVSHGKHLRDIGPGDFIGEIGLLRGGSRTASVIATTTVKAIAMSGRDFRAMNESMPEVAREVERAIEERLERDRLFGVNE